MGFLSLLLGTIAASILGNELAGRVMPTQPLTNFEIQKYYQKEPKFNGVYSRNNSSKVKNGIYNKSW